MIVRGLTAYFLRTARQIAQNAAQGAQVATHLAFGHPPFQQIKQRATQKK